MSTLVHGHRGHSGKQRSPTYISWFQMKQRCNNPKHKSYYCYGGRGITYDPRWDSFINFLLDMGERPENRTLDRKLVNGNYNKDNCVWSDIETQNKNRRFASRIEKAIHARP